MTTNPGFILHPPGQEPNAHGTHHDAHASCLRKQEALLHRFENCKDSEALYMRIMELGKELPAFPTEQKTDVNRVQGCQSTTYLHAEVKEGKLHLWACSDSMISQGLAALLLAVYSGEPLESVLCCPPAFLETLGIASALTPSRASGLYSMHLHLKKRALHLLTPPVSTA